MSNMLFEHYHVFGWGVGFNLNGLDPFLVVWMEGERVGANPWVVYSQ
jgi:hypothetical protein